MKALIYKILLLCWLFTITLISTDLVAQRQVQVVTKSIERKLSLSNGDVLVVDAEKASIQVESWNKNYAQLVIKLVSKHPDLSTAEKELEYLRYSIEKLTGGQKVKNYFQTSGGVSKVRGSLLTQYEIKLPPNCKLDVTNLYGTLTVKKINADFKGQFKFVDVKLIDQIGTSEIESFFGDIMIENYNGKLKGTLEKSDLKLIAFEGEVDIKSNYGQIEVNGGDHDRINIDGNRTEVIFTSAYIEAYNYALSNTLGDIELPSTMGTDKPSKQGGVTSFNHDFQVSNGLIKISTSYSPIILKRTYNADNK